MMFESELKMNSLHLKARHLESYSVLYTTLITLCFNRTLKRAENFPLSSRITYNVCVTLVASFVYLFVCLFLLKYCSRGPFIVLHVIRRK
jgi:hypothetical protein